MSKLLAGIIAALLVGVGVAAASSLTTSNDDQVPTSSISTIDSTASTESTESTEAKTTETGEDVSGPCDEAEHANDARCAGGTTTANDDRADDDRGRETDDDADDAEDNRGRGRDHEDADRGGEDHSGRSHSGGDDGDRSGSNSGDD
jgi:hypothetical protein